MIISNKHNKKIFCIGHNKTGTTSLEAVLKEFGYKMADQTRAERLIKYYKNYNWNPIIKFCKTAEVFQDIPFSCPYTWLILQHYFPKAKFILTTRNEEEWYRSITQFHANYFSDGVKPPDKYQLQSSEYNYKGFAWEANRSIYKTPEDDIYNKNMFIKIYQAHNTSILNYFQGNVNFIHLDISKDKEAYMKLASFLEKEPLRKNFPHLNKTKVKR